ncbi:MAG TPA: type 4 pilus major pilin [Burkholderiales bacterium]|nr:type 4 pilus major pilin [Burkholderiales bacterium]
MNVNKNINNTPKSQQGISLFDFVLWFTIVGIVILAIYNIYLPSKNQANSQIIVTELNAIQSAARVIYQPNSDKYKNAKLDDLGDLPPSITNNGTTYTSNVGGAITLKGETDGSSFTVTYDNMPKTICLLARSKALLTGFTADVTTCDNGKPSFTSN